MVVRPQDCTNGSKNFQADVEKYINYIDGALKDSWIKGMRLIIPMPSFDINTVHKYSVQEEVKRLYAEAGWDIRFESSQFEPEPWIWIAAK